MNLTFKSYSPDLVVVAHNAKDPSDAEWEAFLVHMEKVVASTGRVPHTLVTSLGGAPSSKQRAASKVRVADKGDGTTRIAVLTPSPIVRGAATILRWITRTEFMAFAPSQLVEAIAFLGVHYPAVEIDRELDGLRASLS